MVKRFEISWLDGKKEVIEGSTIADAFIKAGATMKTIESWKELKPAKDPAEKFQVTDEQLQQVKWLLNEWRTEAESSAPLQLVFTKDKQFHLYTEDAGKMIGKKGALVKKYSELISSTLNRSIFIDVKVSIAEVSMGVLDLEHNW